MMRRILAFALWGYFGWYAAALVLSQFGMPTTLAPLGGVLMIAFAAVDWPALVRATAATPAVEAADSPQRTS